MKETQKMFTPLGVDYISFAVYDRHFWQRVFERFGFETIRSQIADAKGVVAMTHGEVHIVLMDPERHTLGDFLVKCGDMQVLHAAILVDSIEKAAEELSMRGIKHEKIVPFVDAFGKGRALLLADVGSGWALVQRDSNGGKARQERSWKSRGVDHFAIGVRNLEQWEEFYRSLGFTTIYAPPHDRIKGEYSGMKTVAMQRDGWVVALVEGVDSNALSSQVSTYVKAHGDHAIQHAAIGFSDLYATFEELKKRRVQFRLRRVTKEGVSPEPNDVIHVGEDHSGPLFQCFTKPWARRMNADDPDMSQSGFFFELIQRISAARKSEALEKQAFDDRTVIGLFNSIEREQVENDTSLVFPDDCMRGYKFGKWIENQKKL